MGKRKNISGQRFGKLLAIEPVRNDGRRYFWRFKCDCGNECESLLSNVTTGNKKSCGCLVSTVQGLSHSRAGQSWRDMMRRCYDEKSAGFATYGAKGITVCEFLRATPLNLIALIGHCPSKLTIDRIKNQYGYHCGSCAECLRLGLELNVRWADRITQARNRNYVHRIEIHGETLTPPEIAEKYGIKYRTIKNRMSKGLTGVDLITTTQKATEFLCRGKHMTIPEISRLTGISRFTLYAKVKRNKELCDYFIFGNL